MSMQKRRQKTRKRIVKKKVEAAVSYWPPGQRAVVHGKWPETVDDARFAPSPDRKPDGIITDIVGRMILDSRGNPTVEVDCYVDDVPLGRAAVPSGASTGTHEATEIRDGGPKWLGRGVDTAVDNVNGEIRDCLRGMLVDDQEGIDQALIDLDGTPNKSRLGANAILGASLACFKASFEAILGDVAWKFRPRWSREGYMPTLSDDELFDRLREWRHSTKMASSHLKPDTLSELATKRPKTKEELPRIRGIGPWITKKFGAQILDIIHAGANHDIVPCLPVPMMNILNGGAHAASNVDIQEFMVVPHGFDNFPDALRAGTETYHALKEVLKRRGLLGGVGDEGGFAPDLNTNEDGLRYVVEAIKEAGYAPGEQISIALDCAAEEFFDGDHYHIDGRELTGSQLGDLYSKWLRGYPIVSIEDPFGEDDWDSWSEFNAREGDSVQVVGDDIYVTNLDRLQRGINEKTSNAILIKPNQVGTVKETLDVIETAKRAGFRTVISHRSGETSDYFISDLAFWTNAGQIKTGAPARSDRTSKYNQLLRIADMTTDCYTDDLF
jgi:enolase